MSYSASAAQINFIRKLIKGKFLSVVDAAAEFGVPNPGSINKNEAGALIDWLKSLDRTPEQSILRDQMSARNEKFSEMLAKLLAKEITLDEFSAWHGATDTCAHPAPDDLATAYKGSGHALAAVKEGRLIALLYLRDLLPDFDPENVSDAITDARLAPSIHHLSSLGDVRIGMVSCGEFNEL